MLENIENFEICELKNPKFIQTGLVKYKQNGIDKTWEVVKAHDSVAILIYHKEKDSFILVKQFRPAVYMGNLDSGITIELCAGDVSTNQEAYHCIREDRPPQQFHTCVTSLFPDCGVIPRLMSALYE
jgi:UDP-sugar diphosphatase